jgi:hypothetical protein
LVGPLTGRSSPGPSIAAPAAGRGP